MSVLPPPPDRRDDDALDVTPARADDTLDATPVDGRTTATGSAPGGAYTADDIVADSRVGLDRDAVNIDVRADRTVVAGDDAAVAAAPVGTATRVRDTDYVEAYDDKGPVQEDVIRSSWARIALALLRIGLGFYFLWAFLDKTFGLGYSTPKERAWINGGEPTRGFLTGAANGDSPFAGMFKPMVGAAWADWLFMLGLLGIGLALILGLATRFAAICGIVMVMLMYLAAWPVGHDVAWAAAQDAESNARAASNPWMDSHIVEALAFFVLATTYAGDTLGLGKWGRKLVGNSILR